MAADEVGERVDAALDSTPRERFLPPRARALAGVDAPVDIGAQQTCSQPSTVRDMLVLLDARPGHRVLDIGAGSGWTTTLLAHLVGPQGRVFGVERLPELVAFGSANVSAQGMPWADVRQATDGVLGVPEEGPYDRILVSAMAAELDDGLVAQLAVGGVLVAPVAGRLVQVVAHADGPVTRAYGHYRFVPLIR